MKEHKRTNTESKELQYTNNNEIDLLDLAIELWYNKKMIITLTSIITIITIIIVSILPKSYKSEIKIIPPQQADLELIRNIYAISERTTQKKNARIDEKTNMSKKLSPQFVFEIFSSMLHNKNLLKEFFKNSEYIKEYTNKKDSHSIEVAFNAFYNSLTINIKMKKLDYYKKIVDNISVSLTGKNPKSIASFLNEFYSFIESESSKQFYNNAQENLNAKILLLKNEKLTLKNNMKNFFKNSLLELQSAFAIAKKAEIEKSQLQLNIGTFPISEDDIENENNHDTIPKDILFLKGYKIIQAEIEDIKEKLKLSNEQLSVFNPEIQLLNSKINKLKTLNINSSKVKTSSVTLTATPPIKPSSPQKMIITISSFIFGCFLSFIIVLFQFIIKQKND